MTLNQLFWELTKEKFAYHEINFGGAAKISSLLSIMLRITPWTLMLMLHVRQSIYLVLTNVLSTSFLSFTLHSMKSAQHCLYNSGKGRCTRHMWSNDMFKLWNCISAFFYEDRECCLHIFLTARSSSLMDWFLTSWTFKITSVFLEFKWIPMLAPLRSINNLRFSWFHNVFLKSFQDWMNSVQQYQGNFTKDAGQKMFILFQTFERLSVN